MEINIDMKDEIKTESCFDNFLALDIRTGTIIEAEDFPKAKRPAYKLKIDFGKLGIKENLLCIQTQGKLFRKY